MIRMFPFSNEIVFNTPRLSQFISLTPTSKAIEKVHIFYLREADSVHFSSRTSDYGTFNAGTLYTELDWEVTSLEQVCTSSLPPFSVLEELYIYGRSNIWRPNWQDSSIENTLWLELLYQFTAVKDLYLSGDRTTEVLLTLQNIWLEGVAIGTGSGNHWTVYCCTTRR